MSMDLCPPEFYYEVLVRDYSEIEPGSFVRWDYVDGEVDDDADQYGLITTVHRDGDLVGYWAPTLEEIQEDHIRDLGMMGQLNVYLLKPRLLCAECGNTALDNDLCSTHREALYEIR